MRKSLPQYRGNHNTTTSVSLGGRKLGGRIIQSRRNGGTLPSRELGGGVFGDEDEDNVWQTIKEREEATIAKHGGMQAELIENPYQRQQWDDGIRESMFAYGTRQDVEQNTYNKNRQDEYNLYNLYNTNIYIVLIACRREELGNPSNATCLPIVQCTCTV